MPNDNRTYEEWLENWTPSRHLQHACLPANLDDPYAINRLREDVEAEGDVPRFAKSPGTYNAAPDDEALARQLGFLQKHQAAWSQDFWGRMVSKGVRTDRLTTFINGMAEDWVKRYAVRQKSPVMLALKASIQAHDRFVHRGMAGHYVIDDSDFGVPPLFDCVETAQLFQVNMDILSYAMADYVEAVYGNHSGSTDRLFLRRGVCMPHEPTPDRVEASYLSSYSLSIGTTELFSQTKGSQFCDQIPCIFSCPIMAIHDRVIAFAPFIRNMSLDQMEFVVAPPVKTTPMKLHGTFSGIREYAFE